MALWIGRFCLVALAIGAWAPDVARGQPAPALSPIATPGNAGWAPAGGNCHVWNPGPTVGEVVTWEGGCRDGRAEGTGKLVWGVPGRQAVYEGAYVAGRRHGRGRMTYSNGQIYDGEWQDDLRHGQGTFSFMRGGSLEASYVGGFSRGRADGPGTMNLPMMGTTYPVTAKEGCIMVGQQWMTIGANVTTCRH